MTTAHQRDEGEALAIRVKDEAGVIGRLIVMAKRLVNGDFETTPTEAR